MNPSSILMFWSLLLNRPRKTHGYDCRENLLLLIAAIRHSGLRTVNPAAKEIFDYFSCFQTQL
jgi:hypothetical protein